MASARDNGSVPSVPVLLLKTRSQPHDVYEEYFATTEIHGGSDGHASSKREGGSWGCRFHSGFVPVLEHRANVPNLQRLAALLRENRLHQEYGGMIFTSQRAVEGWASVVKQIEDRGEEGQGMAEDGIVGKVQISREDASQQMSSQHYPLYTVGPATCKALETLVAESTKQAHSPFAALKPEVLGAETGNGANLAQYMLKHYNQLHREKLFTFFDAPRLPFVPLIGEQNGIRLDRADPRLQKKPLLFLVGEARRDIIPRTLMDTARKLSPEERIEVDEVEVYGTDVMASFAEDFTSLVQKYQQEADSNGGSGVVVVAVFSPQGCEAMLECLGMINNEKRHTSRPMSGTLRYVIATIGPTTRDYLRDTFGFEADVCAKKPSPEGLGDGICEFLSRLDLR